MDYRLSFGLVALFSTLALGQLQLNQNCPEQPDIGGIVAGCILGTLLLVAIVAVIVIFIVRKRRNAHKNKDITNLAYENATFQGDDGKVVIDIEKGNVRVDGAPGYVACREYESPNKKERSGSPLNDSTGGGKQWTSLPRNPFTSIENGHKPGSRLSVDDTGVVMDPESVTVSLQSQDIIGLGFNICGSMRDGIYVSQVHNRGPANEAGTVKAGDRIMSLAISFENMVYEDALTILSYASPYPVQMQLQKEHPYRPSPVRRTSQASLNIHPLYRSASLDDISKMGKEPLFKPRRTLSEMRHDTKTDSPSQASTLKRWNEETLSETGSPTHDTSDDYHLSSTLKKSELEDCKSFNSNFSYPDVDTALEADINLHMQRLNEDKISKAEDTEESSAIQFETEAEVSPGASDSNGETGDRKRKAFSIAECDFQEIAQPPETTPPPSKKSKDDSIKLNFNELEEQDRLDLYQLSFKTPPPQEDGPPPYTVSGDHKTESDIAVTASGNLESEIVVPSTSEEVHASPPQDTGEIIQEQGSKKRRRAPLPPETDEITVDKETGTNKTDAFPVVDTVKSNLVVRLSMSPEPQENHETIESPISESEIFKSPTSQLNDGHQIEIIADEIKSEANNTVESEISFSKTDSDKTSSTFVDSNVNIQEEKGNADKVELGDEVAIEEEEATKVDDRKSYSLINDEKIQKFLGASDFNSDALFDNVTKPDCEDVEMSRTTTDSDDKDINDLVDDVEISHDKSSSLSSHHADSSRSSSKNSSRQTSTSSLGTDEKTLVANSEEDLVLNDTEEPTFFINMDQIKSVKVIDSDDETTTSHGSADHSHSNAIDLNENDILDADTVTMRTNKEKVVPPSTQAQSRRDIASARASYFAEPPPSTGEPKRRSIYTIILNGDNGVNGDKDSPVKDNVEITPITSSDDSPTHLPLKQRTSYPLDSVELEHEKRDRINSAGSSTPELSSPTSPDKVFGVVEMDNDITPSTKTQSFTITLGSTQ